MNREAFNPNLVDINKRLPPQEKFDQKKRIFQSSRETGADPRAILEKIGQKNLSREVPGEINSPTTEVHPELTPSEAKNLANARDAALAEARRRINAS